jgi:hypothetical protein
MVMIQSRQNPRPSIRTACLMLLAAGMTMSLGMTSDSPASSSSPSDEICSTNFPESRIRKLHLVRPDLLPYPLVYEVYC